MPRKQRTKAEKPAIPVPPYHTDSTTEWGGYVNLKLEEDDKVGYTNWLILNENDMGRILADEVGSGVQFSLKYQPDQQAFCCTITCKPSPRDNFRCCMTTWAANPIEALYLSLYKWIALLGRDMSDYRPKSGTFVRWG